jgi:hypothetical protein
MKKTEGKKAMARGGMAKKHMARGGMAKKTKKPAQAKAGASYKG